MTNESNNSRILIELGIKAEDDLLTPHNNERDERQHQCSNVCYNKSTVNGCLLSRDSSYEQKLAVQSTVHLLTL